MTMLNKVLGGVLVAQIALWALMWQSSQTSRVEATPMLGFDAEAITAISITGAPVDGEVPDPLVLEREDGDWVVASSGGYPADGEQVDSLITKLTDAEVRAPIATTKTSHSALEVADDDYRVRVSITSGDTTRDLVMGSAASNTAHVRDADSDDVYLARGITAFNVTPRLSSYTDPSYLEVDPAGLSSFTASNSHGTVRLLRTEGMWTMEGQPEDMVVDEEALGDVLTKVLKVRLYEPVGTELKPEYGLDKTLRAEWTVETAESTEYGAYTVGADEGSYAYVKADASPFVIQTRSTAFAPLRDLKAEDLLTEAPEVGPAAP